MQDTQTALNNALAEARPTLVEFYSTNCPRCSEMAPIMAELKEKVGDKANVMQINGSEEPEIRKKYHVHTCPTFILFKDGQECWRDSGQKPYSELRDMIDRFI